MAIKTDKQENVKSILNLFSNIFQIFNLGPLIANGDKGKHNAVYLPSETASFKLKGCHHVEIFGRSFNHLPDLKTLELLDLQKLILHPRMFESRSVDGTVKTSFVIETFSVEKVSFS